MHQAVLYKDIIHALQPRSEGRYIDGTVGAGGHAFGILEASQPNGILLGLDVDPQALELAHARLAPFGSRAILVHASYLSIPAQLTRLGWQTVHGIVLDLGVSSMQLDTALRGFSFREDAPLDMRFDPTQPNTSTAADLVNTLSETELADVIYRYGEERLSRRVARSIIQARPIQTTGQLVKAITRVVRGSDHHPATRTFQALRIAVNGELEAVEKVLPLAVQALAPGGRLAVIAFHSLEDRIVKEYFRRESRDCLCPPRQPVCTCGHKASLREITRKPIQPTEEEVQTNPRARSARLRVVEKL
ncbi:MAG: 16S rRNA (cytosine(1402)-N(4))-methyltransferase RsmH [Anaerolineales bacterium]